MKMTFVETRGFTARWKARVGDEALKGLQEVLLEAPDRGTEMPGCGILRKYRVADPSRNKGSRGGLRVIYLHTPLASRIDLIAVFGKDEEVDLSKDELKTLCALAKLIRQEATDALRKGETK